MVASIIVAKLDSVLSEGGNTIPLMAVVLAMVASCNSVGAAVYTESLFKVMPSSTSKTTNINLIFRLQERSSWSNSSGCICMGQL